MKFTELDLSPEILRALKQMKYEELTPIQEYTFPHILAGKDIIARAETGSGKTGACAIPLVQQVDVDLNEVQALIMVPTRELALQYVQEIADIAQFTGVAPFAVYGGFSMQIQNAKFRHGVHILVATPGRLIDLLYNSPLSLKEVKTLVLDEADEMLNMGFIDDIEFIISCLVHDHQTLLFSATMPGQIKKLASEHLKDPVIVELNAKDIAPSSLEHYFRQVSGANRMATLLEYIRAEQPKQAIIFCKSRTNADKLHKHLQNELKSVDIIHGGFEQPRRTSLFNRFRSGKIKFMVATDVASRGLDFSHVSHVINYDFPNSLEAYTHRTGRTARMGRLGKALTLFSSRDIGTLKELIKKNRIEPKWLGSEPDWQRAGRTGRAGKGNSRNRSRSSHNSHNRKRSGNIRSSNKGGTRRGEHRGKNRE